MLRQHRGDLVVAAVLFLTVLVEAFALRSGTLGTVLVIAFAAIAAVIVLFVGNVQRMGLYAAYLCAFTLTWNGWFLGPVRPGDLLILLTILLLLVANPNSAFRTPPWWVKQLALGILVVALLGVLLPTSQRYLDARTVLGATGQPIPDTKGSPATASLGVAFKFVVAVFATPVAFLGAALVDRRAPRRLGILFGAGAALSGWAALADHLGADVGRLITHIPNGGSSRQLGFTNHPNFLAAGTVLGLSFGFWLLCSYHRREQLIGLFTTVGCLGGVYASGSRGGAVCAVLVLGFCAVLHPRTRAHLPTIVLGGLVLAGVVAGLVPSLGHSILVATRLAGGAATEGSDTVRALVGAQGVRDFKYAPIHGIGLQASFDASQVYLQELASGGLILFTCMQVYMGGAIVTAWRYLRRSDMAVALVGSLTVILALNYFEADLTDRFYYVPAAILIAMVHTLDGDARAEDVEPAGVAEPDVEPLLPQHRRPARV